MTDNDPAFPARKRINLRIWRLWQKCVVNEQYLMRACTKYFTDTLVDVGIDQQSHGQQKAKRDLFRADHDAIQATAAC